MNATTDTDKYSIRTRFDVAEAELKAYEKHHREVLVKREMLRKKVVTLGLELVEDIKQDSIAKEVA